VNADPQYNHYWFPPADSVLLYPNLTNPLLKPLVVRQAISEALDRKKLDVLAESGYEPPANPTLLSPGNLRQRGWIDRALVHSPAYRYDPQGAVQLLQRAGYKKNKAGVFVSPSGKPLQFTILGVAGLED
jgi:peptide/nickel transport system substrate-binding protein